MTLKKGSKTISRAGLPHFTKLLQVVLFSPTDRIYYDLMIVDRLVLNSYLEGNMEGQPVACAVTDSQFLFSHKTDKAYEIKAVVSEIFEI